jgi:peptide methionine sulfoxide reductase msrA/msrB
MNCFWGPQDFFSHLPGVTETTVGYSGGGKEHPTYTDLGDHTESIEIVYDPRVISYEKLLDHFFTRHDPFTQQPTQYRSIIFYEDESEQRTATEKKQYYEEKTGKRILTEIRPRGRFYPAEEYHQHFVQKQKQRK